VLPLYAELPQREKDKIITSPTSDKIRIIVSTNIAEESITIPYIKTVIDLGLQKTIFYDNQGTPVLNLEAVSQAQATQRKGRT
jgi:ATP-dependent helicase HrpB